MTVVNRIADRSPAASASRSQMTRSMSDRNRHDQPGASNVGVPSLAGSSTLTRTSLARSPPAALSATTFHAIERRVEDSTPVCRTDRSAEVTTNVAPNGVDHGVAGAAMVRVALVEPSLQREKERWKPLRTCVGALTLVCEPMMNVPWMVGATAVPRYAVPLSTSARPVGEVVNPRTTVFGSILTVVALDAPPEVAVRRISNADGYAWSGALKLPDATPSRVSTTCG